MAEIRDRTGERHGSLVVLSFNSIQRAKNGHTYAMWNCQCDCGNQKVVKGSDLGHVRSCGCLKKISNHNRFYRGGASKLYSVWSMMHKRCEDSSYKHYRNYGGRGIAVSSEWSGAEGYRNFRCWAESHGYKENCGMTLDRINNDLGYSPENCTFTNMKQQSNNKRNNVRVTINGETKTLTQWCEEYRVPFSRVRVRYQKMGWDILDALTVPRYGKKEVVNG